MKYGLRQHNDLTFYLIPEDKLEVWDKITSLPEYWLYDGWAELQQYHVGNILSLRFENPTI